MTSVEPTRIGFVPPRFGNEVVGGAEAVMAQAARQLAARGYGVEILTSCAVDHYTWANHYAPGVVETDGMVVRRFPSVMDTRGVHRQRIGDRIVGGHQVNITDQQLWVNDSMRVPELWHYMLRNSHQYRAIVFAPYMFWTTYAVGQVAPARSIIMPCLHDEPPAKLDVFKPVIEGARGIWFLTEPEAELGRSLFSLPSRQRIVGAGIEPAEHYDADAFRAEYQIGGEYIYYAGRREWGKGWADLVEAFGRLVTQYGTHLKLVTSGVGDAEIPPYLKGRIVDVGFISDDQRNNAMAGAVAYIQPSRLESFSRTVLEAWAAGTMVIANAGSAVVKWHVKRSQAGLVYNNQPELVQALRFVSEAPETAATIAEPGRSYVLDRYLWPQVTDQMEESIQQWFAATAPPLNAGASATMKRAV